MTYLSLQVLIILLYYTYILVGYQGCFHLFTTTNTGIINILKQKCWANMIGLEYEIIYIVLVHISVAILKEYTNLYSHQYSINISTVLPIELFFTKNSIL